MSARPSINLRRPPSDKDVEAFIAGAPHNDNPSESPAGRPPPEVNPFVAFLGPELAAKVTDHCKARGLNPHSFVQQAVRRYLEAQDSAPLRLTRFFVRRLRATVARYVWA